MRTVCNNKTGGTTGSNQYGPKGVAKRPHRARKSGPILHAGDVDVTVAPPPQQDRPIWEWSPAELKAAGYIHVQRLRVGDGYPDSLRQVVNSRSKTDQTLNLAIRRVADEDGTTRKQVWIRLGESGGPWLGRLDDKISDNLLRDRSRGGSWRIKHPWAVTNQDSRNPDLFIQFEHEPAPVSDDYVPYAYDYWPKPFGIRGIRSMASQQTITVLRNQARHDQEGILELVREGDNPYDTDAVAVYLADTHTKIGYLPADTVAPSISADLDHGYAWTVGSYRMDPSDPPRWLKIHRMHRAKPTGVIQKPLF